jgi:hypothetical protein
MTKEPKRKAAKSEPAVNTQLLAAIRKEIRDATASRATQTTDISDFSTSVIFKLGRIESLLEEVNAGLAAHVGDDKVLHADLGTRLGSVERAVPDKLDTRLGSLERSRAWSTGAVMVLAGLMSFVTNLILKSLRIV